MLPELSMYFIIWQSFDLNRQDTALGIEQPQHLARGPQDVEVVAGVRRYCA
jgi:hypothetical protein